MAPSNRQARMIDFLNWRIRVIMNDNRQMVGQLMAFDKHMNLVIADCEETRQVRKRIPNPTATDPSQLPIVVVEEKRPLGLVILRGQHVMATIPEAPPAQDPAARLGSGVAGAGAAAMNAGPGISRPIGRGAGPVGGLQGPPPGVTAPGLSNFPAAGYAAWGPGGPPPPPPGFQPGPPGSSQPWRGPPGGPPPPGFQSGPPLPPPGPPGPGRSFPPPPGFSGGR